MTVRICIEEGEYVEIYIPEKYNQEILESDKYLEFRKLLLEIIGK